MNLDRLAVYTKGLDEKKTAILLWVGLCVLYILTLSAHPIWDSVEYAYAWERNDWWNIFHPHHLMAPATGWLLYRFLVLLGYTGRAIWPMAVASSFFGASASTVLFSSLWKLTKHLYVSLISTLLFAVSIVVWRFSVEAGVYALATFVLLVALWFLLQYLEAPSLRRAIWVGVSAGLAIVAHEMNLIYAGLVGPLMLYRNRRNIRHVFSYGVPMALTAAVLYGVAGRLAGARQPQDFFDWLTWYLQRSGQEAWGGWYVGRNALKETLFTFIRQIVFTPQKALFVELLRGQLPNWRDGFLMALFLLLGALAAGTAILLLGQWKSSLKRYSLLVSFFGAWFVGYTLFLAWVGSPREGWIFVLVPLWMLLGMIWASIESYIQLRGASAVITLLFAVLGVLNLWGEALPTHDPKKSHEGQVAWMVEANTQPDDLIIAPNSPVRSYIPYFARRENCISTYDPFRAAQVEGGDGYDRLRETMEAEWDKGNNVFVLSSALDLAPDDLVFQLMQTDKDRLVAFFNAHQMTPVAQCETSQKVVTLCRIEPPIEYQ